jgi:hypothetical protein
MLCSLFWGETRILLVGEVQVQLSKGKQKDQVLLLNKDFSYSSENLIPLLRIFNAALGHLGGVAALLFIGCAIGDCTCNS